MVVGVVGTPCRSCGCWCSGVPCTSCGCWRGGTPYAVARSRVLRPAVAVNAATRAGLSKAGSTLRSSRAVPHPSTNRALRRLTAEVGRDPVHSTRYGRRRSASRHTMRKQITFGRATGSGPAALPGRPAALPGRPAAWPGSWATGECGAACLEWLWLRNDPHCCVMRANICVCIIF